MKELSAEEIKKHSNSSSCWIVIHKHAYDLTEFLPEHPVSPSLILKDTECTDLYLRKKKHTGWTSYLTQVCWNGCQVSQIVLNQNSSEYLETDIDMMSI
jgi:hypothetical protein